MLNTLLNLNEVDRNNVLRKLKLETKKYIFKNIPTLTEELNLDKVKDYEKRVQLRYGYIQKHPDVVFWDYAECILQNSNDPKKVPGVLVSTNGDFIILNNKNRLYFSPLKTKGLNNYLTFRVGGSVSTKHRIIASTFLPRPVDLPKDIVNKLQVNHLDKIKYNNKLINLEWVTNQENQKHAYNQKHYKEKDYFLFTILIDNGFKGREFVLQEDNLKELNVKTNNIKNKINGNLKNTFWGMACSDITFENIGERHVGVPNDILKLFHTDSNYFDVRCKPIIGTVLDGKYEGFEFSLFGCKEIEKYFNRSHVHRVARGERKSHFGCSFRFSTHKEAIPLHGKLTKNIINEVKSESCTILY